jgi:hypothetical protein
MARTARSRYILPVMHKPLVQPLSQPLQQPLAIEDQQDDVEERNWEPSVRIVVFDDSPSRSSLPRGLDLRQQA